MSQSDIAVAVRGLSKSYTIVHDQEKHSTLAETLLSRVKNPLNRPKRETFWALKDVSFEIKKGEVVGIIGRNGAGKSTLLKILSRITEPTAGQIDLYGRVGSLLEVGTGFHPELTGRENIFLNGAILGMNRGEIRKQFDAIVDFAGVEQFIDTPVKRYSSGMYVRLAFAVAAHLNPEILIIDEVLAVGDAEFQKKCLGKMQDVASQGRTVLFVSHNLSAVLNLCSNGLLLDEGSLALVGEVAEICGAYADTWQKGGKTKQDNIGILRRISLIGMDGVERNAVMEGEPLRFGLKLRVPPERCLVSLILRDSRNTPIFELFDNAFSPRRSNGEEAIVRVESESVPLLPGHYSVDFWLGDRMCNRIEKVDRALEFELVASAKTLSTLPWSGAIKCGSRWECL